MVRYEDLHLLGISREAWVLWCAFCCVCVAQAFDRLREYLALGRVTAFLRAEEPAPDLDTKAVRRLARASRSVRSVSCEAVR